MPAITFSLKDLEKLVGKKLSIDQVEEYAHLGKGDMEEHDEESGEIKIDFGDTNLPYLWSVEGFARMIKGVLGISKGVPELKLEKGDYELVAEKSVGEIRPHIACFVAKGHKIDDYLLKQIIQLQEKFCETYGRRRKKVSIGLYSYKRIKFPVHYKAVSPESVEFIPLEFKAKMSLKDILSEHPKGKEYSYVLESFDKYPILVDSNGEVLSFIPIINSNLTGKLEIGDENIFFEATGTDENAVNLAAVIFAYALFERGFKIYSINVKRDGKAEILPKLKIETINIEEEHIEKLFGMKFKETEIKNLLEKAQYNFSHFKVEIPPYRADILHQRDVIEDLGIMYGYNNIEDKPLSSFTAGSTIDFYRFIDKIREMLAGMECQEIVSAVLTNKKLMLEKMQVKDDNTIEIQDYMSETYSAVRNWILPILMDVFSKNKHASFPQKLFEEGIVNKRKGDAIAESHSIAIATSHEKADYTEVRQILDYIISHLGLHYEVDETVHDSFIEGRTAVAIVKGKKVAVFGEVKPSVLANFGLEMPVSAIELNLTELYEVIGK